MSGGGYTKTYTHRTGYIAGAHLIVLLLYALI